MPQYNPDNIPLYSMQPIIPSVLQQPNGNSMSVYRVLARAKNLLERYQDKMENDDADVEICIEDLQTLIAAIK